MGNEELNSCIDEASSLDYSYDEMVEVSSSDQNVVKSVKYIPKTIFNQGAVSDTSNGCTRFWLTHISNAQNEFLMDEVPWIMIPEIDPLPVWVRAYTKKPAIKKRGDSLQNALNQFKDEWLITGFAKLTSEESMKHSLDNCRLIYTGSFNGNWELVRKNKVYSIRTDGKIVGHAFCIVGYDNEWWIAINSYGKDNGVFHIPYSLTNTLFTRYSILDNRDEEIITNYKIKRMGGITIEDAKKALENNFWNGEYPQAQASREEVAAMIQRLYIKLSEGK